MQTKQVYTPTEFVQQAQNYLEALETKAILQLDNEIRTFIEQIGGKAIL
jgi:hypothetical protein